MHAGKCLCDPEGGTCKCAAAFWERNSEGGTLPTSWDFYCFCKENLTKPDKPLSKKHGRGIYRRFFYYVPAFGEGAVNYNITRWTGVKGSNGVHQMAGGVNSGTVQIRGRSCHCPPCYVGDGEHCFWFDSMKQELMWEQPIDMEVEAAGRRPELRGDQEKKGHQTAMRASVGDWAAFLVKNDEGWMIAKLLPPRLCAVQMGKEVATMAKASNIPEMQDGDESKVVQVAQVDVPEEYNWMGDVEIGDDTVYVEKWEPRVAKGSARNEFVNSGKRFACFSGDTRLAGFKMKEKVLKMSSPAKSKRKSKRKKAGAEAQAEAEAEGGNGVTVACLELDTKVLILQSLVSAT